MEWRQFNGNDLLTVEFTGYDGPAEIARLPETLAALAAAGLEPGELRVGGRDQKYTADHLRAALAGAGDKLEIHLGRSGEAPFDLDLTAYRKQAKIGAILRVTAILDQVADRAAAMVAAMRLLGSDSGARFGFAHSAADAALGARRPSSFEDARVVEIYWLNVLGPRLVDALGRARVLTTPAHAVEELAGGAVLLLTRPSPADYASDIARQAQARALAHLRGDVDYDETLARLRERSARLAQVERRWDPDVAPLLEHIVDWGGYADRGPSTARFNDYHPPAVAERRADPLPPDVTSVDQSIAAYTTHAEKLIAALHDEIPGVMEADPAALPRIDLHFWKQRAPEKLPREYLDGQLAPAIGGYLGQLLVRHLGGHWVPRRNLDEAQVVVAGMAWLPFLRARHYLASTQSLIDYSLTQFFHVAGRESPAGDTGSKPA